MKIGIISDIHGNIDALKKVFEEFFKRNVEEVICLGDVIGIGPYPEKCVEYLINKNSFLISWIKGNHERYLINGIPKKNHNEKDAKPMSEEQISSHVWNHSKLNREQVEYINKLKDKEEIEVLGKKIIIEHYPMNNENKFKRFIKNPTVDEIEELFENKNADIYLFGHTHQNIYIEHQNKLYINPGSLGCPEGNNYANVGILEIFSDSNIRYEQISIKYDVDKVIKEINFLNYPLKDYMIDKFYKKI